MRTVVDLPRRSLVQALLAGAVIGAVFLGVGGRVAMRIFAGLDGRDPGFSVGGSLTVVFMGAAWGLVGGFLLWLGRRWFRTSPLARAALFWVPLSLLYLRGLSPLTQDSLVAFTPFYLLYGSVLYRTWCRHYVARWAGAAALSPAA